MKTTHLNKPREFWFFKDKLEFGNEISSNPKDHEVLTVVFRIPICTDDPSKAVHVIEKSAYDELQKKLEIATKALESIGKLTMSSYLSLKDLIEDKMFVAQEALKQIEETKDDHT